MTWWAPVPRGLFVDPKHRERMGSAIWLYVFFLHCADLETGREKTEKDKTHLRAFPIPCH